MNYTYFWFSCLSRQTNRTVYFFKPKVQLNLRTSCNTSTSLTTVSRKTFMFHNKIHFQAYSRSMFRHFESIWYIRAIQPMFFFFHFNLKKCSNMLRENLRRDTKQTLIPCTERCIGQKIKATWLHLYSEHSGIRI